MVLDSKLDNFLHHSIVAKGDLHEHWGDQDSSSQFSNCPADAVEDFVHTVNKSKIKFLNFFYSLIRSYSTHGQHTANCKLLRKV